MVRTVGMITTAKQAEAIVAEGKADMVALARAFLDSPHWGWHAAQALSHDVRPAGAIPAVRSKAMARCGFAGLKSRVSLINRKLWSALSEGAPFQYETKSLPYCRKSGHRARSNSA